MCSAGGRLVLMFASLPGTGASGEEMFGGTSAGGGVGGGVVVVGGGAAAVRRAAREAATWKSSAGTFVRAGCGAGGAFGPGAIAEAMKVSGSKVALRGVGGGGGVVEREKNGTALTVPREAVIRTVWWWRGMGVSTRAIGMGHELKRWPQPRQLRQRTGSRQSLTRWSLARQRKQPVLETIGVGRRGGVWRGLAGVRSALR